MSIVHKSCCEEVSADPTPQHLPVIVIFFNNLLLNVKKQSAESVEK